jgi:hypothetical protein
MCLGADKLSKALSQCSISPFYLPLHHFVLQNNGWYSVFQIWNHFGHPQQETHSPAGQSEKVWGSCIHPSKQNMLFMLWEWQMGEVVRTQQLPPFLKHPMIVWHDKNTLCRKQDSSTGKQRGMNLRPLPKKVYIFWFKQLLPFIYLFVYDWFLGCMMWGSHSIPTKITVIWHDTVQPGKSLLAFHTYLLPPSLE